jgi:EmrB/QacA subfamily drug resistance transporter
VAPTSASPAAPRPTLGRIGLLVVLTAQLVVVLDFTIVNVALPNVSRQFAVSSTTVQWVVTAYALTFGGLLVLGGRAADLVGRRRLFVVGLVAFAAASAAGGAAVDFRILVAARAVQGLAAAVVAPAALSILTTSFPEGPERTRVLGYYVIVASVGFVVGLVLGGVLVQTVDWRGVFYVNVPLCLGAAAIARRALPADGAARVRSHLDIAGACLVTAGAAALVYAPTAGVDDGWTSPLCLGAFVASAALLAAFVAHERRSSKPLLPLSIFRSRTLVAGNVVTLLVGAWVAAQVLVLTLYLQDVRGYSPLWSGLAVAPQGVGGLLRGLVRPSVVARLGVRRFMACGAALAAIGMGLLLQLPSTSQYPVLGLLLVVVGFGTTIALFGATVAGSAGVTNDQQGLAGALLNAARQIGSAVGVAVLLAIATAVARGRGGSSTASVDGYRVAMEVAAGLAVVATVASLTLAREQVCQECYQRLRRHHLAHPWPLPQFLPTSRR